MSTRATRPGKSVRRSALILATVALTFYFGFILWGVLQA